jgi:cell division protein FtsL
LIQAELKKSNYNYDYSNIKSKNNKKAIKWENIRVMLYIITTMLLIGFIVVTYIGQSLYITRLNYQLAEVKEELKQLDKDNYHLNIKLAQQSSLARIEKIARAELHMIEPEKIEVVVLNRQKEAPEIPLDNNRFFFARVINSIMDRIGTVQAGEMDQ